jgi:hypothetical protein
MLLLVVVTLCLLQCQESHAFLPLSSLTTTNRRSKIRPPTKSCTSSVFPTTMTATWSKNASTRLSVSRNENDDGDNDAYAIATDLMNLVVERRNEEIDDSFEAWVRRLTPSYQTKRQQEQQEIEALIESLQLYGRPDNKRGGGWFGKSAAASTNRRRRHTYNVMDSLLASGFFCTLYWYTPNQVDAPKPLWEQVSLKKSNIKGQQYYERNDLEEAVINYAEIWGRSIYLTAEGTFWPIDGILPPSMDSSPAPPSPKRNALSRLVPGSRSLRTCPDVFQVDATKVTLHVFGMELQLPIRGSSNLVIVYADPRIRILVSPMESQTVVGNWEEAGLVVVQVRSDLVMSGGSSQKGGILQRDLR